MTFIDQIKNIVGDYFFRKKYKALNRKIKPTNLKKAVSIGIIYDATNEDVCTKVKNLVKVLRDDKRKIKALGFINGKTFQAHHLAKLEFDFFSKADLNWYNHSQNAIINNFINKEFDILLDLNFDNCKPAYYIAGLSRSTFKVGKLSAKNKISHDFLIDSSKQNDSMDYFISQAQHYLQLINSHE
jgi:hypothetical protein